MAEWDPWKPPVEFDPPRPPLADTPQPVSPPPTMVAAQPEQSGKGRPWLTPLIIAAVLAFSAGAVGSYVGVAGLLGADQSSSESSSGPPIAPSEQPLVEGDSGRPASASPISCPDACFDTESVRLLIMDGWDFRKLGVPEKIEPAHGPGPVALGELIGSIVDDASEIETVPECAFDSAVAPYGQTPAADGGSSDPIYFLGHYEDDDGVDRAVQTARLFATSDDATTYLVGLHESIDACSSATRSSSAASVTAVPALEVPDSVAVVGWVSTSHDSDPWRMYVFDIQSANVVVRIELTTDGTITEKRFRSAVQYYLRQVSFNSPEPGEGMSP